MSCQENCGAVLSVAGSLLVQVTVAVVSMSHGHLIENCGAVLSVAGSLLVQVTVAVVSMSHGHLIVIMYLSSQLLSSYYFNVMSGELWCCAVCRWLTAGPGDSGCGVHVVFN
ncbi:hypothetical protein J6590_005854 [Homalodisca vitripennis]|nr:hypothetical protein J6590_005854 [Homalodisca vitripennis]